MTRIISEQEQNDIRDVCEKINGQVKSLDDSLKLYALGYTHGLIEREDISSLLKKSKK